MAANSADGKDVRSFIFENGPGRERLFDCARLGPQVEELEAVKMDVLRPDESTPARIGVRISGVHQADAEGVEFFFWGYVLWGGLTMGLHRKNVFGRLNTTSRRGGLLSSDTSFFENPFELFKPSSAFLEPTWPEFRRRGAKTCIVIPDLASSPPSEMMNMSAEALIHDHETLIVVRIGDEEQATITIPALASRRIEEVVKAKVSGRVIAESAEPRFLDDGATLCVVVTAPGITSFEEVCAKKKGAMIDEGGDDEFALMLIRFGDGPQELLGQAEIKKRLLLKDAS